VTWHTGVPLDTHVFDIAQIELVATGVTNDVFGLFTPNHIEELRWRSSPQYRGVAMRQKFAETYGIKI